MLCPSGRSQSGPSAIHLSTCMCQLSVAAATTHVLLRVAMLARYMLSLCFCPSVRHKPGWYPKWPDGWSWCLAWELRLTYRKLCCTWKFGYLQNYGTSVWHFVPNTGVRKFRHGKSTVTKLHGRACGLHLRLSSASWLDAQCLLYVGRL